MSTNPLEAFRRGLRHFRGLDPNIPSTVIDLFLTIAMNEGQTATELGEMLGANKSSISRQMAALTARGRDTSQDGLGLVEGRADETDWRARRYFLTRKGKLLVDSLRNA